VEKYPRAAGTMKRPDVAEQQREIDPSQTKAMNPCGAIVERLCCVSRDLNAFSEMDQNCKAAWSLDALK